MTEEDDFGVDCSKASGRRSYCKECDRRRGRAYYAEHWDELQAKREAAREAAWEAELKELEKENRRRVAANKKLHDAQVRPPAREGSLAAGGHLLPRGRATCLHGTRQTAWVKGGRDNQGFPFSVTVSVTV
jgi:hypothetical protein